jgi:hypothetical protein
MTAARAKLARIDIETPSAAGSKTDFLPGMILSKDGETPRPLLANVITVLRSHVQWRGVLAYNEFSLYAVTGKPTPWQEAPGENWTDRDDSLLADWLQHFGLLVNSKIAAEAAQTVAKEARGASLIQH